MLKEQSSLGQHFKLIFNLPDISESKLQIISQEINCTFVNTYTEVVENLSTIRCLFKKVTYHTSSLNSF